jgi:hypothetical protein
MSVEAYIGKAEEVERAAPMHLQRNAEDPHPRPREARKELERWLVAIVQLVRKKTIGARASSSGCSVALRAGDGEGDGKRERYIYI